MREVTVQSDGHDFSRKFNLIETEILFVPYLHIAQRSRAFFLRIFTSSPVFRCLAIHIFPLSLSVVRFRSLDHCTKNTPNHSRENQCERAIDIIKTTKRKQTTNFFSLRLSHGRRVDTWIFLCSKPNEERWPKSFTFDGASVGNWIGIDVDGEHPLRNVQFEHGEPPERRTWNSFNQNSCEGWIHPMRCVTGDERTQEYKRSDTQACAATIVCVLWVDWRNIWNSQQSNSFGWIRWNRPPVPRTVRQTQ